jgi:hypothetical protein
MGLECRKGLRLQTYNILCGPVLSIWKDVETIVLNANGTMQVTRFCRLKSPFNASEIYLLGCLCTRRGQKDCWFNYPDDL